MNKTIESKNIIRHSEYYKTVIRKIFLFINRPYAHPIKKSLNISAQLEQSPFSSHQLLLSIQNLILWHIIPQRWWKKAGHHRSHYFNKWNHIFSFFFLAGWQKYVPNRSSGVVSFFFWDFRTLNSHKSWISLSWAGFFFFIFRLYMCHLLILAVFLHSEIIQVC